MNSNLEEFYNGKTVLVTGHTGFKGSWLSWWLIKLGAKVIGYSLDPLDNDGIFSMTQLSKYIVDIRGDIRDKTSLDFTLREYQPDVIFHLAAQPLVIESYDYPYETFEINLMGTINLLQSVKKLTKKITIIVVTTDKVYRNNEDGKSFVENDSLGGYDPYSSSKACTDILVESWRYSFFPLENYNYHQKSLSTVRAGNVIGGGDSSKNRIIPDVFKAINSGESLNIRNPNSVRPWQHVLDPIYGYILLAFHMDSEPSKYSGAWNFGPSNMQFLSVMDLISKIKKYFPSLIVSFNQLTYKESQYLSINSSKSNKLLSWEPKIDIDEAVKMIVEWETNKNVRSDIGKYELYLRHVNNSIDSYMRFIK
jgi:CDP-glucose 4,6-dehydratase